MAEQKITLSAWEIQRARMNDITWFLGALFERFLPINRGAMTPKERVRRTVEFKNPDRIPHRYLDTLVFLNVTPRAWQPPEGQSPYVNHYDVLYAGWKWKKRKDIKWLKEERHSVDEFGTIWHVSDVATMGEPVKGPLEDGWHLLDGYKLPDLTDEDRYRACRDLIKLVGRRRYLIGVEMTGMGPFLKLTELRGFTNSLMDLIQYPDQVQRLMSMLADMYLDSIDNFHRVGMDAYYIVDDLGTQKNSFISPQHFREFFMPVYHRLAERCHSYNMHFGVHSCGNIRPLVPLMIESGVDFLELDSPSMCGVDWLAENAAGKVAFFNSVDIQTVYMTNDPKKIDDYMGEMMKKLSRKEGGLLLYPYTQPYDIGVKPKSIKAEMRSYKKYRNIHSGK